ncbi:hypothetical protein NP493_1186g00029 [Ridgeia piscesae]|uniref:Uncharacterized protein n=1 Tax=Ridgeia piscesae TaxID=27915 RepID=A0AAD9KF08_RIDPI|nr:hypothetical protein NP493_1186g00029 [Ridgeia piscesae]
MSRSLLSNRPSSCLICLLSSPTRVLSCSRSIRSSSSCFTARPLLYSISSSFLMLSSRAHRVCFCVSMRISISSTVLRRMVISFTSLSDCRLIESVLLSPVVAG